jgi:DtxR family transcriptional regulator, Mn-dependent transcriptional regulator
VQHHEVSEQMQEYLETIYRLEADKVVARTGEIAKHLHVAPASVTDMIQRLEKSGHVQYEPYKGVVLTPAGRAIGKRQLEKHRIMQAFLQEICGMDHKSAHDAACDMEHTLPKPLEDWCAKYLHERLGRAIDTTKRVKDQIE